MGRRLSPAQKNRIKANETMLKGIKVGLKVKTFKESYAYGTIEGGKLQKDKVVFVDNSIVQTEKGLTFSKRNVKLNDGGLFKRPTLHI